MNLIDSLKKRIPDPTLLEKLGKKKDEEKEEKGAEDEKSEKSDEKKLSGKEKFMAMIKAKAGKKGEKSEDKKMEKEAAALGLKPGIAKHFTPEDKAKWSQLKAGYKPHPSGKMDPKSPMGKFWREFQSRPGVAKAMKKTAMGPLLIPTIAAISSKKKKQGQAPQMKTAAGGKLLSILKRVGVPAAAAAGGAAAGGAVAHIKGEKKRKAQLQQLADLFRKANVQENQMIARRAFQAGRGAK
jgi:hypothetical protein